MPIGDLSRALLTDTSFDGWEPFLRLIASMTSAPTIIVIDELPFLLEGDPALEGVLQKVWDRYLSRAPVLLIIVGSDLSMMESLGQYDRPLYQRMREMVIHPLSPAETAQMLQLDAATALDAHLIHGGFPTLVRAWQGSSDVTHFLGTQLTDATSPLVVVGERILNVEFPPALQARAVLEAIGSGQTTFSAIGNRARINQGSLARTLDTLVNDKRVIAVDRPLSAKPSRNALYRVADPYLCRHHDVQLGLATDGRWWVLVSAPRGKVTTTAIFDTVAWNEATERDVVRAFVSLLCRRRFFGVPDEEKLVKLLRKSEDSQEEITEALGVQVRQAVELLVAAIGRADTAQRERGEPGLQDIDAHDVYRGAVSVMMRIVFLLFAEERGLLPSDNELYATAYSAGRLCKQLEDEAQAGSEDDLEHSHRRWHRLLALFEAVYRGIDHPRLRMHAHDGSLFDPDAFDWLPRNIDDRTVLHMLLAVQYIEIGAGKSKERRKLSFRELDVEQIGYVYAGLLSYDGFRAEDVTVSLIGKRGFEKEVGLRELEGLAARCPDVPTLAKTIADEYKDYKVGSPRAVS